MACVNLNDTASRGPLTEADFRQPPRAPAPAEACSDIGCDIDDDGGQWEPAPPMPLWAAAAALTAAALGFVYGPDLLEYLLRP